MSGLLELLEKIKAKPALYIGKASIRDLRTFILGYRFARSELGIAASEAEQDFYKNFQPWLQTYLQVQTVTAWDKMILAKCLDDRAAFDDFFQLLEKFCQRDRTQDLDPMLLPDPSASIDFLEPIV